MIRAIRIHCTNAAERIRRWLRLHFAKPSTKFCPFCGSTVVVPLRSINRKICNCCKQEFEWNLSPGQKPLQGPSRADRRQSGDQQ